jgi:hypothetical protein
MVPRCNKAEIFVGDFLVAKFILHLLNLLGCQGGWDEFPDG